VTELNLKKSDKMGWLSGSTVKYCKVGSENEATETYHNKQAIKTISNMIHYSKHENQIIISAKLLMYR
jgi:hypothetical protein